jgi:hypothetical protein
MVASMGNGGDNGKATSSGSCRRSTGDHHAAPDSLPTLTYYSKIGELCGAQPEQKADRAGELLAATARDSEQKADRAGEAPAAMVRDPLFVRSFVRRAHRLVAVWARVRAAFGDG